MRLRCAVLSYVWQCVLSCALGVHCEILTSDSVCAEDDEDEAAPNVGGGC
jgi:hypothetical protein